VSLFFKQFANPPFETVVANALNSQMLDSAARNLDHEQDSPITNFILHVFTTKQKPFANRQKNEMQRAKTTKARAKHQSPKD